MDMKKRHKIPDRGELPDLSRLSLAVGAKQLKKAVLSGAARQVFLALDADPGVTEPLEALCRQQGIPYSYVRSMADLGRACRIEVGAAAAAIAE